MWVRKGYWRTGARHQPCPLLFLQFSIYLMDERLPLVPMLKWDHGLPSSPLFARLLPPASPGFPRPLLLGGQGGQLQLLHITGQPGGREAHGDILGLGLVYLALCPSSRRGALHAPAGRASSVSALHRRLPLRLSPTGTQEAAAATGASGGTSHRCDGQKGLGAAVERCRQAL